MQEYFVTRLLPPLPTPPAPLLACITFVDDDEEEEAGDDECIICWCIELLRTCLTTLAPHDILLAPQNYYRFVLSVAIFDAVEVDESAAVGSLIDFVNVVPDWWLADDVAAVVVVVVGGVLLLRGV
ncbi:hypothetical protein EVAR_74012_1 [Eumeta japonica]|uniref:Uncharacterized protein n=1 Tax=Eumeta variegata TaxID=151549 RepID=A0A4C1TJK8_EUMVA|nr:hypothetical protein EVAR_74012_1 [Eumeta japonica]